MTMCISSWCNVETLLKPVMIFVNPVVKHEFALDWGDGGACFKETKLFENYAIHLARFV